MLLRDTPAIMFAFLLLLLITDPIGTVHHAQTIIAWLGSLPW